MKIDRITSLIKIRQDEKKELVEMFSKLDKDICNLKIGDIYVIGKERYKIIIPYKPCKFNTRLCFGLSQYIGDVNAI